jgi:L-asparaginase
MPSPSLSEALKVVILGTGGTIAGTAAQPQAHVGYRAGALSAADLTAGVPALAEANLEVHSLAQMDSCNMDHATWQRLGLAIGPLLERADVAGVVITHGTDTLEETACFLHHTVRAHKPVVLTAAMRPATAPSPDGPQNLVDAVAVASTRGAQGVLVVFGGTVFAGDAVRKVHGYRVEAFASGDQPALGLMQDGRLRRFGDWPPAAPKHADVLQRDPAAWPVVDIVTSHAGARSETVNALVAAGARGIVVAGTGNGSVHAELLAALKLAQAQGVAVRRASRCLLGGVVGGVVGSELAEGVGEDSAGRLPSAGDDTPAQARVRLMLELAAGA